MCNWLLRGAFPDAVELALGPLKQGLSVVLNSGELLELGMGQHSYSTPRLPETGQTSLTAASPFPPIAPAQSPQQQSHGSFGFSSVPGEPNKGECQALLMNWGALTENWYLSTLLIYSFILLQMQYLVSLYQCQAPHWMLGTHVTTEALPMWSPSDVLLWH